MMQKTSRVLFYIALVLTPIIALYPQQALPKLNFMYSNATNRLIILLLLIIKLLVGAGCAFVGLNYKRYANTPVRVITVGWVLLSFLTFAVVFLPVSGLGVFSWFHSDHSYLIFAFYLVLLLASFTSNNRQTGEQSAK